MVRTLRAELGTNQGTVRRVATPLGYELESVRSWVTQTDIDEDKREGVPSDSFAEIRRPEQELREVRRANEIQKRAASFLGAEPDRQHKR
jgi:transposase-like protein